MLRWLLPVIAAMVLVGSTLTTWAAAVRSDLCCCPVKAKCKCHDHDRDTTTPMIKKCGAGDNTLAPTIAQVIAPMDVIDTIEEHPVALESMTTISVPAERWIEPETPPF